MHAGTCGAQATAAEPLLHDAVERLQEAMAQLPPGFFNPLLPSGSLNEKQVWLSCRVRATRLRRQLYSSMHVLHACMNTTLNPL